MRTVILCTLALVLSEGSDAVLAAAPYGDLVVFGDSLSDNGNFYEASGNTTPPSPPYWEGRFSNGPVWVEELAALLGLDRATISDSAVGFATTEDVLTLQVTPFVSGGSVPPDALYVVWAGPNDFLEGVPDPLAAIEAAMENLGSAIGALAAAGAVDIMVPNMPDLGLTPLMLETGDPDEIGAATALSVAFNDALSLAVDSLETSLGVSIIEFDTFGLMAEIVADPASFDLTNVTDGALAADGTVASNPEDYLFWDDIHPTAVVHALLAESAFAALPEREDTETTPGPDSQNAGEDDAAAEETDSADETVADADEEATPPEDTTSATGGGGGGRSSSGICGAIGLSILPLTLLTMAGLRRHGRWHRR